ncbi:MULTISPECIES: hypothetical protein [unclassified Kosmotoga]|uniref:hypothetical protein n=1 Tax=unclassified Kosmotoga TaxID=2631489 RepID=UPI0007C4988C|nr:MULTISPECIES: hypothetical protein [unclassified Kosmotoga]MDI3523727.1 hypothetical protein [Kosmotoga sp.]MDK2953213.1 hypothetical protein [Kosmotoga sp.]OAA20328.1 hypothetical protein DU53_07990 [Kosmotoga sp. DU53]
MVYRIVFSILPILFMPKIGYSLGYSVFLAGLLFFGTVISKDVEWIPQLQGITLVLLYALLLLGYAKGASPSDYYMVLPLISIGYLFSGFEGLLLSKKTAAILFSALFWSAVAIGLSFIAYKKLGSPGIVMSVVLFFFIAMQDIKKILKKGEDSPI